jgi:hypothetical protein
LADWYLGLELGQKVVLGIAAPVLLLVFADLAAEVLPAVPGDPVLRDHDALFLSLYRFTGRVAQLRTKGCCRGSFRKFAAKVPTWQVYWAPTHVTLFSLSVRSYTYKSPEEATPLHRKGTPCIDL